MDLNNTKIPGISPDGVDPLRSEASQNTNVNNSNSERVDYYQVLSLNRDMSAEQLMSALSRQETIWQQRMMQMPERAQEMLGYISDAKVCFENERSRAEYDQRLYRRDVKEPASSEETERSQKFTKWYTDAKNYYSSQQYDMAKIAIERAFGFLPKDDFECADVYFYASLIYTFSNEYSLALDYINKAIVLNPGWAHYYRIKSRIYEKMSQEEQSDQGGKYIGQSIAAMNMAVSTVRQCDDPAIKCDILQDAAQFCFVFADSFPSRKQAQEDACTYAREAISLGEEYGYDVSEAHSVIDGITEDNEALTLRMQPFYDSIHYSPDYSPEKLEQENNRWNNERPVLEAAVKESSDILERLLAKKAETLKPIDEQKVALEDQRDIAQKELAPILDLGEQIKAKQDEIAKARSDLSSIVFKDDEIAETQTQLRELKTKLDSIGKGFLNSGKKVLLKGRIAIVDSTLGQLVNENDAAYYRKEELSRKIRNLLSEENTMSVDLNSSYDKRNKLLSFIQQVGVQIDAILARESEIEAEYDAAIKEAELDVQEANGNYQKALQIHDDNVRRYSEKLQPVQIGQTIMLGKCIYTSDKQDRPIEWDVIDIQGQTILLISKYILAGNCLQTDSSYVSWAGCSLRDNLNNRFFAQCFIPEEARLIIKKENDNPGSSNEDGYYRVKDSDPTLDNVFLLSVGEARKYLSHGKMKCQATEWAKTLLNPRRDNYDGTKDTCGLNEETGCAGYWLRTPGYWTMTRDAGMAWYSYVTSEGQIVDGGFPAKATLGVRPCICIDLSLLE